MHAKKDGQYGVVQYVNQNYRIRNRDLISKYVFLVRIE